MSLKRAAIFAASDIIAMGVYQAARQLGLRIPDDLSIVGFDDTHLATLVSPPLTTVHQPLAAMGSAATILTVASSGAVISAVPR